VFGSKCSEQQKTQVLETLRKANTGIDGKYLGLPTREGRMNKNKFKTTKEKLINKCSSWEEKHMSMGAKEILIKAIPTYTMGVFKGMFVSTYRLYNLNCS
jgi:hypothetical protein